MLNKFIKILGIILVGIGFFAYAPFTLYAYGPSVATYPATNVSTMNATLHGNVSTGGLPGNAWFEYGTDLNFGNSTSLNAFTSYGGYSGSYSTNISGLSGGTIYYFRAVAQNSDGRVYGNVQSFKTDFSINGYNNALSPTAVTTSGAVLSGNTAQFNSLILTGNTNKVNSWFEWGTTVNLGNQTTPMPLEGAPAIRHTNTITGLAPGTTYYFRAVAQNAYGRSDGEILSLATSGTASTSGTSTNTTTKVTSTDSTTVEKNETSIKETLGSKLGASVFGAGSFFPSTLLGWLILIVFILILVILGRHARGQFKGNKQQHH